MEGLKSSSVLANVQERILRRREMAHLFQWYYPEGGWGFVVLACACVSHALAFGLQLGFGFPLAAKVAERFSESGGWGDVTELHLGRKIKRLPIHNRFYE